jgi:ABC-type lipoprotein release transport system permease subunit
MFEKLGLNIKIGFFLALRQIRKSNPWTTGLIVFVMVLTFLNLVVVSGILVGLIEGSIAAWHKQYTGDVIISTLLNKDYIENSPNIVNLVKSLPEVKDMSVRYVKGVTLEANYQTKKIDDKPNLASAQLTGIDPQKEDTLTGLASHVIEGSYLTPNDYDKVVIGNFLLKQYVPVDNPGFSALENVNVGTKIKIKIGDVSKEVTVKGILKSKVDNVSMGLYMIDSEAKSLIGRDDDNAAQIAMTLKDGVDPLKVKQKLILAGVNKVAKVQTYVDAQPKFLKDIIATFSMLGNALSSIGLVVASITIFIVIFINALTRRKFIGILKGIGINGQAIEISYIMQSMFYAFLGSMIGLVIIYFGLVPLFTAHPIDFPFSDGILVAPFGETMIRVALLVGATIIAGYIPARMIIRKNTLDSILGRN